jgi:hypothetical protein
VYIGRVRYGQEENRLPSSSVLRSGNFWLYPFYGKRECFRWENEIRAIVNISRRKQAELRHSEFGCYVNADIQKLVDSVWLHPQSPAEFRGQVRSLIDSHGFPNIQIHESAWECLR